ncbi:MAG: L-glutamate gamma-semialdehyde dehydrogenase [Acidimicrobiales bacterium]|nr:MAG: L-glutamate gamma-semialdehyde dehydrogenase [Acidimicrobiales bacterium]
MRRADERRVRELGRQIANLSSGASPRVFHLSFWTDRLLEWAMAHPDFKIQLFRLVDVLPATADDEDVHRHMLEYFGEVDELPPALDLGVGLSTPFPWSRRAAARVARRNVLRMARQFIAGRDPAEAVATLSDLWRRGSAFTVDLLGEKTLTGGEADRYARRVCELIRVLADATSSWDDNPLLEHDDLGALPRVNVSVKPSALTPHLHPLRRRVGISELADRLSTILEAARAAPATVHLDMEHHETKDVVLEAFSELAVDPAFEDVHLGVAIQAYLRETRDDLTRLLETCGGRRVPIVVRLVKGAYWDSEVIWSRAAGHEPPVFLTKEQTDANFEFCVDLLHDHHRHVRVAFGSHNVRSLAYAIASAEQRGIPPDGFEIQMLHGMAEPLHEAVRRMGIRHRVYCPVGDLVEGMAYLVRRLLENTSNESFVRHRFAEGRDIEDLLVEPSPQHVPGPAKPVTRHASKLPDPGDYEPEPHREWHIGSTVREFDEAVRETERGLGFEVLARIGGGRRTTGLWLDSRDPAEPERIVARAAMCTAGDAAEAVSAATETQRDWASTDVEFRVGILFEAAERLRRRRDRIAALEVFEAGKPWAEADADVCEAIDFCEYYARQMLELAGGGRVQSPPGEQNRLEYRGRGPAVVISPWNFPLAIPCGMTAAALVAGNAVILKPAEQTPAVAAELVAAFEETGLPPGVLQLLPGDGPGCGAPLVGDPRVATVAFTGSFEVGTLILEQVHRRSPDRRTLPRVVAELGGKNAIVVDTDADPDQVVAGVVESAFGYAGQKCSAASRLVVVGDRRRALAYAERVAEAAESLVIGPPKNPETQLGPLIDESAREKVLRYVDSASRAGTLLTEPDRVPERGWYVSPVVVVDLPVEHPVNCEEIFGPVLTVSHAADLDEAIEIANRPNQALTAGFFSRSPANIRKAKRELRAGNLYVNRRITGAVVGRQPFGGIGTSGVGHKAGGPDYLLQFVDSVTVCENLVRQGFAPE